VCLAIPGRVAAISEERSFAVVDVGGVRRTVNVGLLCDEPLAIDDWVLIHVGFAMSRISETEAAEQMRTLSALGESRAAAEELEGYRFER
jgi:hydrogenase expression/formation protein HypC